MVSQTLLPMPHGFENIYDAVAKFEASGGQDIDMPLKSAIEGAIIKWAKVCSELMKMSSRLAFAHGANPTPDKEV